MPDKSIPKAWQTRYGTLNPANFGGTLPPMFFDGVPQKTGDTQVRVPYIELQDMGMSPDFDFEFNPIEVTSLRMMVYALELASVDIIVEGLKYNGGSISAGLGFDFGSLPSLETYYRKLSIRRGREKRGLAGISANQAAYVHYCEMLYTVTVQRS